MIFKRASPVEGVFHDTSNWAHANFIAHEWLETTGTGGYAASTVCGDNTRKYHGLLVAGDGPDDSRHVLLARLDETVTVEQEELELSTRSFMGGRSPSGFSLIHSFTRGLGVVTEFHLPSSTGGVRLSRTVLGLHGTGAVAIMYKLLESTAPLPMVLEPFVSFRKYHAVGMDTSHDEFSVKFSESSLQVSRAGCPFQLYLSAPGAVFVDDADWFYQFDYPIERERGYDDSEALYRPGKLEFQLFTDRDIVLIACCGAPPNIPADELIQIELERRERLVEEVARKNRKFATLAIAADQCIVRHSDGTPDIIAGYPWFTCWGRDTMISVPGICLATRRVEEAKQILLAWFARVHQGVIPNRLGVDAAEVKYNTVDATLWMFVALHRYIVCVDNYSIVSDDVFRTMQEIIDWHIAGTHNETSVDPQDGLLTAGSAGTQLTWMDAYCDGVAITPRYGKPVEINALWYNALRIFGEIAERTGRSESRRFELEARRCQKSFEASFWSDELKYLRDVVGGSPGEADLRPNQLFALSLPFPLVGARKAKLVLDAIVRELVTPVGLRTLSATHEDYQGRYEGNQHSRDLAYHQGTVWPWLSGPFFTAAERFGNAEHKKKARKLIDSLLDQVSGSGIGTLSEIYDGDEPQRPRGSFAQAWSVAELMRIGLEGH